MSPKSREALIAYAEKLCKLFASSGFNQTVMQGIRVDDVNPEDARLTVSFEVLPSLSNMHGTLHGGVTAALVDVVGSMAIALLHHAKDRPSMNHVSTDLNVSYMSGAPKGSRVTVVATCHKDGKTLNYCTVDVLGESGKLLAQGRHTKYMFPRKAKTASRSKL